jgi:hypothetical protein
MISPNRVKFQKIFSNELNIPDLIMECAFESDNSEVSTYLNREAVSVESYDGRHNNAIRYKYSERFSPRFTFMKKGFGDFESSELRAVLKWLTSSDTPTLLDVYYDDSNVVGFSAVGNWTEISSYKLANSRTVAVVATFEAVHPFALSDLYTVTKTITATDNKITINIDTDDNKPVYPRVTIQSNNANIKFTNKHTDFFNVSKSYNSLALTNNTSGERIIVDGANKIISSSNTKRIFGDDFNWVWLELYDGKNEITVEGNCDITLEYRTVVKCGEY